MLFVFDEGDEGLLAHKDDSRAVSHWLWPGQEREVFKADSLLTGCCKETRTRKPYQPLARYEE
jgi:hypothetical protein